MLLGSSVFYLVGVAMVAAAILVGRPWRGHAVRARDVTGNMIVGDVSGPVSQTAAPPGPGAAPKSPADKVAWAIGIAGLLIMLVQLGHDVLAGG